jgi:large subunit ribosomal protein L4
MFKVPVYGPDGQQTDTVEVDEGLFGEVIRPELLKQAIVRHQANRRLGTAATKSRGMVEGSTRKIYRQKGTGFARMGTVRTCIRRGGGVAFAKRTRDFSLDMPKRMRRLARNQAILSRLQQHRVFIIDGLEFELPNTKKFLAFMRAVDAEDGCLLATHKYDIHLVKSARNLPKADVQVVCDLSAYDVLRRPRLGFTRRAFDLLIEALRSGKGAIPRPAEAAAIAQG